MMSTALKVLLSLEAVWTVVVLVALGVTMAVLSAARKRHLAAQAAGPAIKNAIALQLGGSKDLAPLRELAKQFPEAVETCILAFQEMVGGTERLADLAVTLGFVENWCAATHSKNSAIRRKAFSRIARLAHSQLVRRAAGDITLAGLKDADAQVRLEAARAMVCSEDLEHVKRVFEVALSDSPLNRLLLSPMLRRHAIELCHTAIPKALDTLGPKDLLNLLQLLVSWECILPINNLRPLAEHPDPAIRAQTMRLLAQVPVSPVNRGAILLGVGDDDTAVVTAAVATVGRLKLLDAIAQVTSCLRRSDETLARTAAAVLAEMGPEGQEALEGQASNLDPIASRAAREALELAGAGVLR